MTKQVKPKADIWKKFASFTSVSLVLSVTALAVFLVLLLLIADIRSQTSYIDGHLLQSSPLKSIYALDYAAVDASNHTRLHKDHKTIGGAAVVFYMYPQLEAISAHLISCCLREDQKGWLDNILHSPPAQYYTEIGMFSVLRNSQWRTENAEEADLFYVPYMYKLTSNRSSKKCLYEALTHTLSPALVDAFESKCGSGYGNAKCIYSMAAVNELLEKPYAARKRGFDHIHTLTTWGEDGIRFSGGGSKTFVEPSHPNEELLSYLENGILFAHSHRLWARGPRNPFCNVVVPYLNFPASSVYRQDHWLSVSSSVSRGRDMIAYFRGSANVAHKVYKRTRLKLGEIAKTEDGWIVDFMKRGGCEQKACSKEKQEATGVDHDKMANTMSSSLFCLIPGGDSINTSRLYLAIAANCIPVIIASETSKTSGVRWTFAPFPDLIDWSSFSIAVDPEQFLTEPANWLPDMLRAVATNETRLNSMLSHLAEVIPHLTYEIPGMSHTHPHTHTYTYCETEIHTVAAHNHLIVFVSKFL